VDDKDILANARAKAQDAQSRGRLATDPELKASWQQLADGWLALLAELERRQSGPKTEVVVPSDIGPKDGPATSEPAAR
jgi:hypothetical protein